MTPLKFSVDAIREWCEAHGVDIAQCHEAVITLRRHGSGIYGEVDFDMYKLSETGQRYRDPDSEVSQAAMETVTRALISLPRTE